MNDDNSRDKMDISMFCAKHPREQLTFSGESRVGFSSAYELNVKILVHPCSECAFEFERYKNAVKLIQEANEQDS